MAKLTREARVSAAGRLSSGAGRWAPSAHSRPAGAEAAEAGAAGAARDRVDDAEAAGLDELTAALYDLVEIQDALTDNSSPTWRSAR